MRSFTSRHPSVVETSGASPAGKGDAGFDTTHGARVIDSTPPATTISASPVSTALDAIITASRDDPHRRLTVVAGTPTGQPASRTAMRPTFRLSSPAWFAHPQTTSSMAPGSASGSPARRCWSKDADRSSGLTPAKAPRNLPNGVRRAA